MYLHINYFHVFMGLYKPRNLTYFVLFYFFNFFVGLSIYLFVYFYIYFLANKERRNQSWKKNKKGKDKHTDISCHIYSAVIKRTKMSTRNKMCHKKHIWQQLTILWHFIATIWHDMTQVCHISSHNNYLFLLHYNLLLFTF